MTPLVNAPNALQLVPLSYVVPSSENVRLFVEREGLADLEAIYAAYDRGENVVLPDAPILRLVDGGKVLEVLAGERRITAARNVGLHCLYCRVVEMSDQEAYKFILAHNDVAGITTVELAFRAAEMERLGFSIDEIAEAVKGSPHRYLTVGALVDPASFTDTAKLCNPSIVEWYEAALHGVEHFQTCFHYWNTGAWDEDTCSREFRKRGKALPIDNAEKGFRVTFDNNRLVVRGQVDLDIMTEDTAYHILQKLEQYLTLGARNAMDLGTFGPRIVVNLNPTTL